MNPCPACESTKTKVLRPSKHTRANGQKLYLYRCVKCGAEWTE